MLRLSLALFALSSLLATASAQAVTLSFQAGDGGPFSTTEDSFLALQTPGANYGWDSRISVDEEDGDFGFEDTHGLVRFPNAFGADIGQVPIGATVTSATLTLRVYGGGDQVNVHQLLESWVESQVTWNSRSNGVSWANPGADSPTSSSGTVLDSIGGWNTGSQSLDISVAAAAWALDPTINFGILLMPTGQDGTDIRSSEHWNSSFRPQLVVEYSCIDGDGDGYCLSLDCDDADAATYPGATESCDGIDSDCDGDFVDGFADLDGDGDPDCTDTDDDGDGDPESTDCDDTDATIYTGAAESCDGIDQDCDGSVDEDFDVDGDGVTSCDGDCDDADSSNFPGNTEACDGQDNDCDGSVDEGFDSDGDSWTTCGGDCDDADAGISPSAVELCDGIDNNCDALVDEGFDSDGDGWTTCEGDCDDNDFSNFPGNTELCDGQDNNCDALVDEGFDTDGDGWTTCEGDCDDNDAAINLDAVELCDGVDNNCDGFVDEGFDSDGDGWTTCEGDCDDNDATTNPDAVELCDDGVDQDCDGADLLCGDDDDSAGDDDDSSGDDDDSAGDDDDSAGDDDDSSGDDDDTVGDDDDTVGDDDDDSAGDDDDTVSDDDDSAGDDDSEDDLTIPPTQTLASGGGCVGCEASFGRTVGPPLWSLALILLLAGRRRRALGRGEHLRSLL